MLSGKQSEAHQMKKTSKQNMHISNNNTCWQIQSSLNNFSHIVVSVVVWMTLIAALRIAPPLARCPRRIDLTFRREFLFPIRNATHAFEYIDWTQYIVLFHNHRDQAR